MPNKLAIIADYSTELLIHFGSTISVIPNRFFIATIFDFKLLLLFFATGLNRMCRNPTTRARNRICELWTEQLSTRRKEKKNEFANPENWILRRRWGKTPNQKVSTQYTFAIIYFSRSLAFLLYFFSCKITDAEISQNQRRCCGNQFTTILVETKKQKKTNEKRYLYMKQHCPILVGSNDARSFWILIP